MKSGHKGKALQPRGLFLLFGILVAVGALCLPALSRVPEYRLEVVHVNSGVTLLALPLREKEEFQIHYTHSVDRLPCREVFRAQQGQLVLDEVRWMSFGAGLGYMGQGQIRVEDEWIIIENMNRRVNELLLRVGTVADHRLLYRGQEYPLRDYAAGKELLRFSLVARSQR